MIALTALACALFAWASIATAIAVAQAKLRESAELQALGWKVTCEEERDRAQAFSLSELRAHRPVAMPASEPDDAVYAYDDTGLVRSRIDPR